MSKYKGILFDIEESELTNDIFMVLEAGSLIVSNCRKITEKFLLTVSSEIPDKKQ